MIVAVPAETPVTTPDDEPTVATAALLLLHVTPEVAVVSVRVEPAQIVPAPEMAAGGEFNTNWIPAVEEERPLLVQSTTHLYQREVETLAV